MGLASAAKQSDLNQPFLKKEKKEMTKRFNKDEIKKHLIKSITINNAVEINEINKRADKVEKPGDGADIIKECKKIICTTRKSVIAVVFHQGKVFKCFREKEKFIQIVGKLKIHRTP